MRIVLVHRYFWPDTPPYAHILRLLALRLGEEGHDVTILTCQPSYNTTVVNRAPKREQLAPSVAVQRWTVLPDRRSSWLKSLNLITVCMRLLLSRIALGRVDVVMASSTPPIALAKAAGLFARMSGARFVYHKQDIYPEVVAEPGILRNSTAERILRHLDTRTDRAADRVVVLSRDMARTTVVRGTERENVEVINNFDPWIMGPEPTDRRSVARQTDGPAVGRSLRVVFAGNIGAFQNIETVVKAATQLDRKHDVRFTFVGDGARRASFVQATSGLSNVEFIGYRPPDEVARLLRDEADLGIVSLLPGVIGAAYPSKTMSYLRQGCPVVALVEGTSELAQTITRSGAGFHIDPEDAAGLANLLMDLGDRSEELTLMRRNAMVLYRQEFTADRQLAKWVKLFREVGAAVGRDSVA